MLRLTIFQLTAGTGPPLTSLAPGAIDNGAGDQRTIRFAGHGLDDNNLTLDGVDATAVYNQEQREYMRLNIPLDSIDQFQVQSQNFGADTQSGTAGGQVTVVSPSGTNAFHGSAFDYFRNNAMDARSPFDGASPHPFLLNQFGGGLGGPIIHDRVFFYANYEGLRQRLDGTQIGLVPSPSFENQAALTSPALLSILQTYPAGISATSNPNVWQYQALGRQVDNEDSGMIRFDYYFSNRTTAFVRFNSDEAVENIPTGQLTAHTEYDTKFNNGVVSLSQTFTPTLINEAKFGINQTIYHTANLSLVPFGVSVSGFSALTGASTTDYPSKTFDLIDDVSWVKGRHILKFGFETRWILLNQGTSQSGTLTYNSATAFLNNQMGSASYTAILPLVRQRKVQYWGYVQDEWKATPNLTVTAGIRYNFFNVLHAIGNNDVPFDFATCGGYCPKTDSFSHPRYDDFDPRVGVAWSHGDTVLRAGGGIYHTDGQEDDQNLPISNTVDRYSFSNTAFPNLSFPLAPFLQYAESGGFWGGFSARSRSQSKGRLRGGVDCLRPTKDAVQYLRNCRLLGQQGNGCPDNHLRQPCEPGHRRSAIPGFRSCLVEGQCRQQHLPCTAIESSPGVSEWISAIGELYVVAFHQRWQYRRRRIGYAARLFLPFVRPGQQRR